MAAVAYCPAVQSAQSVLATTLLNLPTGQSEQETEPLAAENTYFPGTQLVQAVAPVVLVPVAPAGQASQVSDVCAVSALNFPEAQSAHTAAPVSLLKVPPGQTVGAAGPAGPVYPASARQVTEPIAPPVAE